MSEGKAITDWWRHVHEAICNKYSRGYIQVKMLESLEAGGSEVMSSRTVDHESPWPRPARVSFPGLVFPIFRACPAKERLNGPDIHLAISALVAVDRFLSPLMAIDVYPAIVNTKLAKAGRFSNRLRPVRTRTQALRKCRVV